MRNLEFRTGTAQGRVIFFFLLFVAAIAPFLVYFLLSESRLVENSWQIEFLLIVVLLGFLVSIRALYHFLRDVFSLCIEGTLLSGKTLIGSNKTIRLEDVKSLKIGPQNNCILQTESGERFGITGAIDYDGFIKDYILLHLPPGTEIDEQGIAKLRANEDHWLYGRRPPRDADYPADYLIWLEGVVRDQKLALMKKGVLSRNRSYEGRTNLYQSGR